MNRISNQNRISKTYPFSNVLECRPLMAQLEEKLELQLVPETRLFDTLLHCHWNYFQLSQKTILKEERIQLKIVNISNLI